MHFTREGRPFQTRDPLLFTPHGRERPLDERGQDERALQRKKEHK
ncbi:MAG: hypothetical protein ACRC35_06650 [Angustibacter sp.]